MRTRVSGKRHHGKFKGNARTLGGGQSLTDVFAYKPPRIVHRGIRRANRGAPAPRPLTERHQAVLAALGHTPQGQSAIARRLGLRDTQVTSALYVLASRGLVEHVGMGKGWVKADAQPQTP